jgi:hypothetical protein
MASVTEKLNFLIHSVVTNVDLITMVANITILDSTDLELSHMLLPLCLYLLFFLVDA